MNLNQLEQLPRDVLFYFALEFDLPTVLSLCRTSKRLNQNLCQSDEFWSQKLFHDYKIRYQDIGGISKSKDTVKLLSQFKDPNFILLLKGNNIPSYVFDRMLVKASREGKIDIVKYLIGKSFYISRAYSLALSEASEKGHLDVVKYLHEHGADILDRNNTALIGASQGGHLNVVKYLVEHGSGIHGWDDQAMREASEKGHLDVVKYLESL